MFGKAAKYSIKFPSTLRVRLVYDNAMLEDLDHLATRIEQLVQHARALHAERESLLARLREADAERQRLRERCDSAQAQCQAAQTRLADCVQNLEVAKSRAERTEAGLRASLAQQAAEHLALMTRHETCRAELARLCAATTQTRDRIGAVLARLPGAQPDPTQANPKPEHAS